MAKDTPAPKTEQQQLTFTQNDLVGAIQRLLRELDGYLWTDINGIDPAIVHAYLERAAQFNSHLPVPRNAEVRKAG